MAYKNVFSISFHATGKRALVENGKQESCYVFCGAVI